MHTNKFLYVFFYFLNTFFCEKASIADLKGIVSKKETKVWLDKLVNATTNSTNNRYCHLCCILVAHETIGKHCGAHTLCKYLNNATGPACKGFIQIGFSNVEKIAIVDVHNTLRNRVASGMETKGRPGPQPSAANMRLLEWNDELAFMAERWAAQCIYAHDICRDLERFPVGQNLAHGNLATTNELSFIKEWYDEVKYFDCAEVVMFKL